MRSFFTALICLSTLVGAQNVLAISAVPASASGAERTIRVAEEAPFSLVRAGIAAPTSVPPGSMGLLVVGLAGLTAAGTRSRRLGGDDGSPQP